MVCCYAACWGPTKRKGVDDVKQSFNEKSSGLRRTQGTGRAMAPFIVTMDETSLRAPIVAVSHCYYFWFFGYIAKLPYERQLPVYNSNRQQ